MSYDAMLRHGEATASAAGCCGVGSAAVRGRTAVCAWTVASHSRSGVERESPDGTSVVSRMASAGSTWAAGGWPARAQAASGSAAARAGRHGPAAWSGGPWLQCRALDLATGGDGDRAPHGGSLSPGPCLVHPPALELVGAAPGTSRPRAGRGGDSAVGHGALARGKKNACRQRAWLIFEDESGVSQHPVVRRTWAARGKTPILTHTLNNWRLLRDGPRRLSPSAEAVRPWPPGDPAVGRAASPQESRGADVRRRAALLAHGRAVARLCPGPESSRARVRQREGTRARESLRPGPPDPGRRVADRLGSRAPLPAAGACVPSTHGF